MNKLLKVALLSASTLGLAFADTSTKYGGGFYLGAGAGFSNGGVSINSASTRVSGNYFPVNAFLGYGGPVSGSLYFGGELNFGYTLGDTTIANGTSIKQGLNLGAGLHVGAYLNPSTIAYIVLSASWDRYRIPRLKTVTTGAGTTIAPDGHSSGPILEVVPGIGVKTFLTKHVSLGLEYTITLAGKKSLSNIASGVSATGTLEVRSADVRPRSQRAVVRLAYNF